MSPGAHGSPPASGSSVLRLEAWGHHTQLPNRLVLFRLLKQRLRILATSPDTSVYFPEVYLKPCHPLLESPATALSPLPFLLCILLQFCCGSVCSASLLYIGPLLGCGSCICFQPGWLLCAAGLQCGPLASSPSPQHPLYRVLWWWHEERP